MKMSRNTARSRWLLSIFLVSICGVSSPEERRFVDSHVTCARDFMQLNIRLNTQLWQKLPSKIEMHLADKHCKPFIVNSSHVFIRTSHYDCGTKSKVTQDHVIFTNSFIAREETQAGQMVSYFPDVEVGFRCTYNRKKILPISAPLQLDKLHSSPKEVTTYYGLPVEVKCAFKYGASPVRAVISHKGKIVARQENGTQSVTVTVGRMNKDFGLYTCLAEDANHEKITYNIKLKKIDPSSVSVDGKKVTCTRDGMQLTLDRLTYPWLQPKYFDMRLLDSNCRPFHVNVTHVIVKTKHEECNTVRTSSPGGVIYRNILMALLRPQPGRLITRVPNVLFPFQCRFDPKKVASISSKNNLKMITPIEPLTVDKSKSSPSIVKTLKRFDARLVCTFKGGAPPINIRLTRRGRRLTDGVVVKGRVLFAAIKTNHRRAFNSYECTATDAKENKMKHKIYLQKAGPRDIKSNGLTLTCKSNSMDVSLSRLVYPWLHPEKFHISLIQSNCAAYNVTEMQIRVQASLFGCGTRTLRRTKSVLESRNVVIARVKRPRGFSVTYLPDMYFPFLCRYEISRSAGKMVFKPLEPLSIDSSMSSAPKILAPPTMPIKFKCVFHGGEPPIQVSISRHNVVIARAQGRMLSYVFKPRFQDGGRYVCKATDARKKTVRHVITLEVPVNGVMFDEEAALTECGLQFTTVTLDREKFPWLNTERMRMHLNDPLCRPSHVDNAHISFKIPPGSCGSRHIKSPREVIFANRVLIQEKSNHNYNEKEMKTLMEVHFLCRYKRIGMRSKTVSQKRLL